MLRSLLGESQGRTPIDELLLSFPSRAGRMSAINCSGIRPRGCHGDDDTTLSICSALPYVREAERALFDARPRPSCASYETLLGDERPLRETTCCHVEFRRVIDVEVPGRIPG